MSDIEKGKKALDTIRKKGDLYDVIAQAKNLNPTYNPLVRMNVLLLSRILYLGLLAKDKIVSYFSPIEKVHSAQQDIRSILGFNVDIVKDKKLFNSWHNLIDYKKELALLYEDNEIGREEYLANLRKILSFCELQNINVIYLNVDDLARLYPDIVLNDFKKTDRVFELGLEISTDKGDLLLVLNPNNLKSLIDMLVNYRLDKELITFLVERIEDISIKRALEKYNSDGDLNFLTNIIKARLTLNLNSDSTYKNRDGNKNYDTIIVKGEFIQKISNSKNGNNPEVTTMSLYEYLGYANFNEVLKGINMPQDDEEKLFIAALYLYLYIKQKGQNFIKLPKKKNLTLYDGLYNDYLTNKKDKSKPIAGLRDKGDKTLTNIVNYAVAFYYTAAVCCTGWLGLVGIDIINRFLLKNEDSHLANQAVETILSPYKSSMEIEEDIINRALSGVFITGSEIVDNFSSFVGDVFGLEPSKDKVLANIICLNEEYAPNYYGCEYGVSSTYEKGNISYELRQPYIGADDINYDIDEETLKVVVHFSRKEVREMVKDNKLHIPLTVYPCDEGYYLSRVVFLDDKDSKKEFSVDASMIKNGITDEVKKYLTSFKKPKISYCYAKGYLFNNTFANSIHKEGTYLTTPTYEMRHIIAQNLGLSADANIFDIYLAIRDKKYSTTPFKDAGLSSKIKKMDEKEYIATVASMDSIVCNLAATLAVEATDDLIYVTGFCTDDNQITYGMGHAWAMDETGFIYDVTPSAPLEEEEKSIFTDIFSWAVVARVPLYIAILLISTIFYQLLGKRIIFTIKKHNLKNLLTDPEFKDAYSLINELRYDGISLPKERGFAENLEMIANDFEGYSKEELRNLLQKLKEVQDKNSKGAIKVVKTVPFIKKNEKKLTRGIKKSKR